MLYMMDFADKSRTNVPKRDAYMVDHRHLFHNYRTYTLMFYFNFYERQKALKEQKEQSPFCRDNFEKNVLIDFFQEKDTIPYLVYNKS